MIILYPDKLRAIGNRAEGFVPCFSGEIPSSGDRKVGREADKLEESLFKSNNIFVALRLKTPTKRRANREKEIVVLWDEARQGFIY